MDIQSLKQRFGIIGNSLALNRAIEIAIQVAPTDLTVLISGESGVGKENFPKIIHQMSARKHGNYVAINCGAIPEGTIDSELFGHEKGSFTGATDNRKGYFEVADGGTIFLDEVAELPTATQARLLRVLENKEFMKVGSSKIQKTDVRVIAATNVNLPKAIEEGKFREDLYYRLNTVPVSIPSLRERKEDILLLFRKFAADFSDKYRMPTLRLTPEAQELILSYRWKGNVRQLKNVTEQISIIEQNRLIDKETIIKYLPGSYSSRLPVLFKDPANDSINERDILYKVLFDMKRDITDLKKLVGDIMQYDDLATILKKSDTKIVKDIIQPENVDDSYTGPSDYSFSDLSDLNNQTVPQSEFRKQQFDSGYTNTEFANPQFASSEFDGTIQESEIVDESLSLQDMEVRMIKQALKKHNGKRKLAAEDLEISERTLYRKIKEYNIN
ncbi:MAG: sigma-54-dependent Fis family transcriptional regulator [Bacteroidetes bacterium 4572_112]|nr:MAG: sigma-54-dependent Fis family transcriptional regulator [Bacteroidetes bacterium 4572_112]